MRVFTTIDNANILMAVLWILTVSHHKPYHHQVLYKELFHLGARQKLSPDAVPCITFATITATKICTKTCSHHKPYYHQDLHCKLRHIVARQSPPHALLPPRIALGSILPKFTPMLHHTKICTRSCFTLFHPGARQKLHRKPPCPRTHACKTFAKINATTIRIRSCLHHKP